MIKNISIKIRTCLIEHSTLCLLAFLGTHKITLLNLQDNYSDQQSSIQAAFLALAYEGES